ncbi:MAG: glutamine-hydrolyzing GMP synthase [Candidatus Melainabacteria bacterium RIFCSPLOWO2_12_FULL_35_11]|nr:MAG: glutamine-hydrolyzing GMP synthase [Candidatus Melainabacteria bacterium RIFCSPLOWO2_12_FULL_35_11]
MSTSTNQMSNTDQYTDKNIEFFDSVIVLDFGSQYSELIARRIRELNVYSELVSYRTTSEQIKKLSPKGIILSGGPNSVYDQGAPDCDPKIFELGIPVLGVCYGMQLMSKTLGGKVIQTEKHEYGKAVLEVNPKDKLFLDLESKFVSWMSHGDSVTDLPGGFIISAKTKNTPCAAISNHDKKLYGVQFHPEVIHTMNGLEVLRNFVINICLAKPSWTMDKFIGDSISQIHAKIGDRRVLLALSGGVDSSTLAFLLHKAVPENLMCMFIDQGFMRKGEPERLTTTFQNEFAIKLHYVNAKERFVLALKGIIDPEEKRKIIGREFIRVFEEESKKIGPFDYLAQGTLYPDVIESADSNIDPKTGERVAVKIKSHHNVGGLPKDLQFKLIEPFRKLFKDEVRKVARQLGVPKRIIERHPFPGPGLAIRIIGEVTEEKLYKLREADSIIRDEVNKSGLYNSIWQVFGVLLPVQSVGVMGDKRTYSNPIVLRAITSEDGMTADWAKLPYEVLEKISTRLVNEVPGINRVVYDITSKPPATIEWE